MSTVLIDADSVVYRCGFAGEVTSLQVAFEDASGLHTRGFVPHPEAGSSRAQLASFLEAHPDAEVLDETVRVDADPLEHVLHSVKLNIEGILQDTGTTIPVVFLTGKDNYRDKIATIRPYKGNRDKLARPVHYDAIRAYLVDKWQATIIEGEEADDAISILARTPEHYEKSIVASIDKDLDQIPGKHFDFLKKVSYDVRPDEAEFVFYRQCLSGDSVDNVPGCYKIGQTKAEKLLEATPRKLWWKTIVETYEASKKIAGCPYADKTALSVAIETAQLVRLRTVPGEIWTP